jgi:hypothetical protein
MEKRRCALCQATLVVVELLEGRRLLSASILDETEITPADQVIAMDAVADESTTKDTSTDAVVADDSTGEVKSTDAGEDAPIKIINTDLIRTLTGTLDDGTVSDPAPEDNQDQAPADGSSDPVLKDPTEVPVDVIYYSTGGLSAPAPTLAGGVLAVNGTDQNDIIEISLQADDASKLLVSVDGHTTPFNVADVSSIQVSGLVGNDTININQRNGVIGIPAQLDGGAGNDTLGGGSGNDSLTGGEGNDRLIGRKGDDLIRGGAGDDRLMGRFGDDSLRGNAGSDDLEGGAGSDDLSGGAGRDVLAGGAGSDSIRGGGGNDRIRGGGGNDFLDGGMGFDRIRGDSGADAEQDPNSDVLEDADPVDAQIVGGALRPIWWDDQSDSGGDTQGIVEGDHTGTDDNGQTTGDEVRPTGILSIKPTDDSGEQQDTGDNVTGDPAESPNVF